MTATTTDTGLAVLELLDREACAINMTGLVQLLPDHDQAEIKRLTNDLYMQGKINRVPVMGPRGRYYSFYSLFLRTANGYVPKPDQVATSPAPAALPDSMSTDQALAVLERAGWVPESETTEPAVPERRAPDRRRLTVLEVIKRWRLTFPLARVVEIIGNTRKGVLSRDDAALAIRMIRAHMRGDE